MTQRKALEDELNLIIKDIRDHDITDSSIVREIMEFKKCIAADEFQKATNSIANLRILIIDEKLRQNAKEKQQLQMDRMQAHYPGITVTAEIKALKSKLAKEVEAGTTKSETKDNLQFEFLKAEVKKHFPEDNDADIVLTSAKLLIEIEKKIPTMVLPDALKLQCQNYIVTIKACGIPSEQVEKLQEMPIQDEIFKFLDLIQKLKINLKELFTTPPKPSVPPEKKEPSFLRKRRAVSPAKLKEKIDQRKDVTQKIIELEDFILKRLSISQSPIPLRQESSLFQATQPESKRKTPKSSSGS